MRRLGVRGAAALATVAIAAVATDAAAVVGMPATPFSVAGVARRTTRRAAYASAAAYGASAPASMVSVLPAGCAEVVQGGVAYQHCGTTYYRPYYQGPNLVYVVSPP